MEGGGGVFTVDERNKGKKDVLVKVAVMSFYKAKGVFSLDFKKSGKSH